VFGERRKRMGIEASKAGEKRETQKTIRRFYDYAKDCHCK
jgi:hypothetical protein